MMDLKTMKSALEQLEAERGIPKEKILSAIADALVAAYKKDYGKKNQIIRATFDPASGKTEFVQVKIVVDETMLKTPDSPETITAEEDKRVLFNDDQHIMIEDAKKIRSDIKPGEELIFPLEARDDYGRIAAQTAKQVIIQRIREAEKTSILTEYATRQGAIISGKVQKIEHGFVYVDLGRATAILAAEEQIPSEHYRQGERIRAYLAAVEETPRGINLRLSRTHPNFIQKLFELEAPEIANGLVAIRAIAREPGFRAKIAVFSSEPNIDPVGSCVGQRGVRVNTVINELGGEKIDIIEWSENPRTFITNALSPAKIKNMDLNEENKEARIEVEPEQFSLAVGKRGQNVRLASKLTGWKIEIVPPPDAAVNVASEASPATQASETTAKLPEA